jgi:hypothetical protein
MRTITGALLAALLAACVTPQPRAAAPRPGTTIQTDGPPRQDAHAVLSPVYATGH